MHISRLLYYGIHRGKSKTDDSIGGGFSMAFGSQKRSTTPTFSQETTELALRTYYEST